MSKTDFYIQCKLRRGDTVQTTYLPERYAVAGEVVRLLGPNNQWTDGWRVESLGARLPAAMVEQRERDHLHQRNASDLRESRRPLVDGFSGFPLD